MNMPLEDLFAEIRANGWTCSISCLANDWWKITIDKIGDACDCVSYHDGQGLAINLEYAIRKMHLVVREFERDKAKAKSFMAQFTQAPSGPPIRRRI